MCAADRSSGALRAHAAAANTNVRSLGAANSNVANLAAQFQDIGVSAAMSMNPLQIALQQGTQIGAVLGPMGAAGAVKSLGSAFLSIISPVSLVTIGLVAAVAAGLQLVNWAKLGAAALIGIADSLQVIAPYAIGAAAALALLYAPAIIGGIVQVIALLGRMAVAATIAAAAMIAANPGLAFTIGVPDRDTGIIVNREFIGGVDLDISPIPRVSDLTIQTVTVDLSQIAIAVQEIAREYDLRLAKADIYEVTLNPLTKLASGNPEIVFMGEVNGNPIDTPAVGEEGSIELELNSDAISMLTRTNPRKSSYEGQKRRSGDEWGKYSSTISSWSVPWGQKA